MNVRTLLSAAYSMGIGVYFIAQGTLELVEDTDEEPTDADPDETTDT